MLYRARSDMVDAAELPFLVPDNAPADGGRTGGGDMLGLPPATGQVQATEQRRCDINHIGKESLEATQHGQPLSAQRPVPHDRLHPLPPMLEGSGQWGRRK